MAEPSFRNERSAFLFIAPSLFLILPILAGRKSGNLDIYLVCGMLILIALLFLGGVLLYRNSRFRPFGKKTIETKAFLHNVLRSVDNIVNYYEPVYGPSGRISDFTIVYANECNREYLGLPPEKIMGMRLSEVFPFLFLNGGFDGLVKCQVEQKKVVLRNRVVVDGGGLWFDTVAKPLSNGVFVTARNATHEREAEEKLRSLNERLEEQNQELRDTESFLNSVIKSTDSIINYLEPVLDMAGRTMDFEIILMNDASKRLTGLDPGECTGRHLSEVYPRFMDNGIFGALVLCTRTGTTEEIEVGLSGPGGVPGLFTATAVNNNVGVTLTLNGIVPVTGKPLK